MEHDMDMLGPFKGYISPYKPQQTTLGLWVSDPTCRSRGVPSQRRERLLGDLGLTNPSIASKPYCWSGVVLATAGVSNSLHQNLQL